MHLLLLLGQPNVSQAARPMGPITSLIPTTEPVHATGYIILRDDEIMWKQNLAIVY